MTTARRIQAPLEGLSDGELFWLNDTQWAAIEPLLPRLGGKPRADDQRLLSGIQNGFREGLRWRALPEAYGPRTTVFNRFNRWSQRGLWQDIFAALVACADPPRIAIVDSTSVRAHRSAAGGKGGEQNQAIGRSRGGRTTKIHAVADGQGRIAAVLLTPGQASDISGARVLLPAIPPPADLIADKAYAADDLCALLITQGTKPVISLMPNRRAKPFDAVAYPQRNLIERAFCRLKDWRAIATRYDKTARNFVAGICPVLAVTTWRK